MAKRLTDGEIQNLIREIDFQPLKITVAKTKAAESSGGATLDVRWKNSSRKFIAEILRQATPKQIETGMLRLENLAKAGRGSGRQTQKEDLYPILIAPYLNEKTLERLLEAEISGIDLSGNGVVIVPDKLFVYRAGAKNKFLSTAPIKNVFRGTSSLVARVLLAKPEYENVGEVLDEITTRGGRTTFSTVSKVLKTLEEELIVGRGEKIRLIDARKLLDALRENYRRPEARRTVRGKVGDLQKALKRISKNAEAKGVLYALDDPAKYVVMPQGASPARIYAESLDALLDGVDFTETNRFPDVELIETDERSVYFDRRKTEGLYRIAPLEVYLKLSSEGKREQETAAEMVKNLVGFKY